MQYSNIKDNLINKIFKSENTHHKLIFINVAIFIIIKLIKVIYTLFNIDQVSYYQLWNNLSLSAHPHMVMHKPWTLFTYMFMHAGFFHILFNMLWLYWFGKIFMDYLYKRKLLITYILGGLSGAVIYLIVYQFIPYLQERPPLLGMVGASASVVAIIVATATLIPNYRIPVLFFGSIRLKYIAIVLVLIDILSLEGNNIGGHFAHLGGALYGFLYIVFYKRGFDLGGWLDRLFDFFDSVFKSIIQGRSKGSFKVYRNTESKSKPVEKYRETRPDPAIIDNILDKIAKSGYDSLSEKEKDILFNASKKQ